jgi:hypothetical protein
MYKGGYIRKWFLCPEIEEMLHVFSEVKIHHVK